MLNAICNLPLYDASGSWQYGASVCVHGSTMPASSLEGFSTPPTSKLLQVGFLVLVLLPLDCACGGSVRRGGRFVRGSMSETVGLSEVGSTFAEVGRRHASGVRVLPS